MSGSYLALAPETLQTTTAIGVMVGMSVSGLSVFLVIWIVAHVMFILR